MPSYQKFASILFGESTIWTADRDELALRSFMVALFIAPPLFMLAEISPTAWVFIAAICAAPFARCNRLLRSLAALAVTLFLVSSLIAISYFWSVAPDRPLLAARDVFGYSAATVILLLSIESFSQRQCQRALQALVVGAWIAIPVLIAREFYFAFTDTNSIYTAHAITLHKITFYGALFAALLLATRGVVSLALASAFMVGALLMGRSAGIDMAIALMIAFFAIPTEKCQRALALLITCYIFVAFVAPLLAPAAFAFLDSTGLLAFHPGTFAARLELWAQIASHVHEAPIFGHGANTIRNAVGILANEKYYPLSDLPSAHNIIFDLWFELGIVGIAIYALTLAALTSLIGRLQGSTHALAASCLMITVIELSVDHRIWLSWVMGTLIMATVICVLHYRATSTQTV